MTKRELINTYLSSIGRTRVQGDSTEPLLPFLLGDAIYTIFNREIAPLDLRREEKRLRSDWARNYTLFNRPFFAAIGGENSEKHYAGQHYDYDPDPVFHIFHHFSFCGSLFI